jgi:signal transduction histidine kinase
MDIAIAEQIACERRIAYAATDRRLLVVAVGGALSVLDELDETWIGESLLDLVPELIGSETTLDSILAGELPRFELARVNRETSAGQTRYLDFVEFPRYAPSGQIAGLVHLVQDVTETGSLAQQLSQRRNELRLLQDALRQRNLELAAANAELRHLDELKSQFVAVAAHELRNPLSAILGYVEMLLDEDLGPLPGEQRRYLEIVYGAGRRLLDVTNGLLDAARIEAGHVDLTLRPTDLGALVEGVAAEYRPQAEGKAQRMEVDIAPHLPAALCDGTRVAQIVGNLVSNAIRYTGEGGQIAVCVRKAEDEGYLLVSVADTGMGISGGDREKLFSRFFRTEGARTSGTGGTGLGLYVTRSLVDLHGGRIWLESEVGKGSTFYVTFMAVDG